MKTTFTTLGVALLTFIACSINANEGVDPPRPYYHESLTPGIYRQWRQSADGRISVCCTTDKTTFTAAEGVTVRCIVRNNSEKPITILQPFGDDFYAESTGLNVLGPDGPVSYKGPQKDYMLGAGSFVELPGRSVIEGTMAIPKDKLPGIDKPGLYVIDYRYISSGYPKQPAPANYWTGQVDSNQVTVVVK